MKTVNLLLTGPILGLGLLAQSAPPASPPAPPPATKPTKIGVLDLQTVIIKTKDGEKAAAALKAKFAPKQDELGRKQQDLAAMETQLRNGQNTMSDENKQRLMREIDQRNNLLKRDTEDANADLEQEQQRLMGELIPKIISVLNKYATENNFALVIDLSSQQTPVLFASNTVELTLQIIEAYDKSSALTTPAQPKMTPPPSPKPDTPKPVK
jgi:outer membrane protein